MKLKLDENLGRRGAEVLQQAGHDVMTVADQGMVSATDIKLARVCHAEQRCLVTLDLDFSNPLRFPPHQSSGIAVLRPMPRLSLEGLMCCCGTLVTALGRDDISGQLWIVDPFRIRRYKSEDST